MGRREAFDEEVAGCDLRMVAADGAAREVRLRVGRPYKCDAGEWACPVELRGFEPRYPDICGEDSLQALCLAIQLLRHRLHDFLEKGGRIFDRRGIGEWNVETLRAEFGATELDSL
jgi:hypothetical protein